MYLRLDTKTGDVIVANDLFNIERGFDYFHDVPDDCSQGKAIEVLFCNKQDVRGLKGWTYNKANARFDNNYKSVVYSGPVYRMSEELVYFGEKR